MMDYETVMKHWREYLDGSSDSLSLALEAGRLDSFVQTVARAESPHDERMIYDLVRHVWDIAYTYGRYDTLIEEAFTLAEID